jgi:hypothetical protein
VVICTADDKLSSDFDLDEGKFVNFREQRPLHSDIVDRNGEGAIARLPGASLGHSTCRSIAWKTRRR